jgi:hypothetical protein
MDKPGHIRTSSTSPRYWYAYGYRTQQAALDAIEDMYADGEISPCNAPRVKPYQTTDGATRYGVQLLED